MTKLQPLCFRNVKAKGVNRVPGQGFMQPVPKLSYLICFYDVQLYSYELNP